MSSRLIPLAWALAGKLPGDKADYRLLASSAPAGDRGALADQVWAAVPSIPQLATLPGPGGLPWVTVIPGEQAGEDNELHEGLHWLAVTVTEATADTDAVGRPSVAIRHIRLSYPDVAGALAGYQALHAAVPPAAELTVPPVVTLTAHGGEPDLASGAAFDRAAGLAALLLDGDVMITVADGTSLPVPARLAEFDRIMALHPYGLRACMTMATWYDGTVRDGGLPGEVDTVGYRLAYGPFSTHGQAVATSGGRVPPPVAETAIAYLAELRAAREELGSRLLMKYLAAHRTVLAPGNGEQVLDILRALRDPSRVLTAIREGRATVEHARNARQFAAGRLHPEERDALDEYLLAQADPATITDLLSTWSERSAALAARALLGPPTGTGQPASRARQFYAAAARVGKAEAFLLALARSCNSSEMGSPQRMLAAYYITELISPESGGMSALRAEVWQEPWLTRELLRLSLSRDPVDQAWLEWLAPGPGQDALQWLPGYSMLIRREDGDPEVSQLRAARLDTLRLYVGLPAIGLPLTGPILATTQYLNALWALWAQPPIDADQAGLIARLLEGIHERLREEPPGRLTETAVVAVLCAAVADDWVPLDQDIAAGIVALLTALPELMDNPGLDEGWWARVERARAGARGPAARLRAAVRDSGASPVTIALRMGEAAGSGVPPETLIDLARPGLRMRQPAELAAMLQIVEGVLRLHVLAAPGQEVDKYLAALRKLLTLSTEASGPGEPGQRPPSARRPGDSEAASWWRRRA